MPNQSDLSKVKKGDALAVLRKERFSFPYRSVKVLVTKKNPKSVVFDLDGTERRVDLDGHGLSSGSVEIWDDAEHERREQTYRRAVAADDLARFCLPQWDMQHLLTRLSPEDLLRTPDLWEQLKLTRAGYEEKVKDLVERMKATKAE